MSDRIFQIKRILSQHAGDTDDQFVGGAARGCHCGAEGEKGGESCWGETMIRIVISCLPIAKNVKNDKLKILQNKSFLRVA